MNLLVSLATPIVCALSPHIIFAPNYARKQRFRILAPLTLDRRVTVLFLAAAQVDSNLVAKATHFATRFAFPPKPSGSSLTSGEVRNLRLRRIPLRLITFIPSLSCYQFNQQYIDFTLRLCYNIFTTNNKCGGTTMTFGQKIKRLRTENNWTQEQFAELMGVSAQAVSRWETDASMPDISLIVPLAYTFNVTCDYLLGMDLSNKKKDIIRIRKKAFESIVGDNPNKWSNAAEMMRNGLKQYPDSWMLKTGLLVFLAVLSMPKHNSDYIKAGEELNALCEEIISKCPIKEYQYRAIYYLCGAAKVTNNVNRATELAKSMPQQSYCQEELLKRIEGI